MENIRIAQTTTKDITNPIFTNSQTGVGLLSNASDPFAFINMYVPKVITFLLIFGALAFFIMFILGGISWILSGGEKGALESAKSKITHALIGIVILASLFAIIMIIENFFDITILTLDMNQLIIK